MTSAIPMNVKNLEGQKINASFPKNKSRIRPDGATWGAFQFAKRLSKVTPRYDLKSVEKDGDMFSLFAWSHSNNGENNLTRERSKFEKDQRLNRQSISAGTRTTDVVAMVSKTKAFATKQLEDDSGQTLSDESGSHHRRQLRRASSMSRSCSVRDMGLEPDDTPPRAPEPERTPRRRAQRRSSMPLMPSYHNNQDEPRSPSHRRRLATDATSDDDAAVPNLLSPESSHKREPDPQCPFGGSARRRRSSMPLHTTYNSEASSYHEEMRDDYSSCGGEPERHYSSRRGEPERQRSGRSKRRGFTRSTSKRSMSHHDGDRNSYGYKSYETSEPDSARRQRSSRGSRSSSRDHRDDYAYETAESVSARRQRPLRGSRSSSRDRDDCGDETAVSDSARRSELARQRSRRARRRSTMDNTYTVTLDNDTSEHRWKRHTERNRSNSREGAFFNDTASKGRERTRRRPSNEIEEHYFEPHCGFEDKGVHRRSGRMSRRSSM